MEGLMVILIAFPMAIVSSFMTHRFIHSINKLTDYGTPIYKAAEHIKTIVNQVNVYGVESLQGLIEKSMKDELTKIVKKEKLQKT